VEPQPQRIFTHCKGHFMHPRACKNEVSISTQLHMAWIECRRPVQGGDIFVVWGLPPVRLSTSDVSNSVRLTYLPSPKFMYNNNNNNNSRISIPPSVVTSEAVAEPHSGCPLYSYSNVFMI